VEKDRDQARDWLEKAAAEGFKFAQSDLDEMNEEDARP